MRGFTVVELLIVLVVVGAFFLAVIFGIRCIANPDRTIELARAWANSMGIRNARIACMKYDTDHDGYVSCTVMTESGPPIGIECASAINFNSGCRLQKVVAR